MVRRLNFSTYLKAARTVAGNYIRDKNPVYASFKVTSRCQFTCDFCNVWTNKRKDLTTDQCIKILKNLGRSSIFLCSFEGGEPLLRGDIEELMKEANRQPFYLMFTTSHRKLMEVPWERYQQYVDFLEISIDEGHDNPHFFDWLSDINKFDMVVCVQTVVREQDQFRMEEKVKRCYDAKCKILLMPAVTLEGTKHRFPQFDKFESEVARLKKVFPKTIITPQSFFRRVKMKKGGCSPNSIVIDSDGALYYPCRTLERKAIYLYEEDLTTYLNSVQANNERGCMAVCEKQCGWYQFFATAGFTRLSDFKDAVDPYLGDIFGNFSSIFGNGKKPVPPVQTPA